MRRTAAALLVALAACSGGPADGNGPPPADANAAHVPAAEGAKTPAPAPEVVLDRRGLRLAGADARLIPFGTTREEVMAALAFRGRATDSSNDECGAGPMQFAGYDDGLQLAFQDGKFVGWWVDRRGPSTLSNGKGLFVGATRADVQSQGGRVEVFESTLGTEFTSAGIGGLLDGPGSAANVTDLWAGTTCTFR